MNKKFMFVIMTLIIAAIIVLLPAIVPAALSMVVHGSNPASTAPMADFTGDPTWGPPSLQVDFSDQSSGDPTGWAWYFGDEDFDQPWTQMAVEADEWKRMDHTSVVLPDNSIVLMGGHMVGVGNRNDVWRSTDQGATWTQMTAAAPWTARRYHTSVALSDDSIVLMGGNDGSERNDVWRSTDQGATWTQMTAAAEWSPRNGHTSVALSDDTIVLMGGFIGGTNPYRRDVWRSTDQGATWDLVTASSGWAGRYRHTSVALSDDKIVLMGGWLYRNDVWLSEDEGKTWEEMTPAASWIGRYGHTSVALPDNSIVLMGGFDIVNEKKLNDVWRSIDLGATWMQMTAAAEWSTEPGRSSVALADGSIVLMGGSGGNEAWQSTDQGTTWTRHQFPRWSGRTSVVLPDGSLVLMGGYYDSNTLNQVWRSTDQGATWTQMTAAAGWSPRGGHSSVALPDGSIVLMGGFGKNDVWRSTDQGAIWTKRTSAAGWTPRGGHGSVVLPDGSIVLMGGVDDSGIRNDVWRSTDQGATWTQMTAAAGWSPREGHSSVALPDGSIVLMGGHSFNYVIGPHDLNDVWRSTDKGATWTQITPAAGWTPRFYSSSVAVPDGSIVLMGGNDGSRRNDVWRSTDHGANWTQLTPAAGWTPRIAHTSVVLPDGSIVLIGGHDGSRRNDVWRLETAGSNDQNSSHIYTEKGIYSVALQVYNTDGFSSTIKKAYINTTGSIPDPDPDGLKIFLPLILR